RAVDGVRVDRTRLHFGAAGHGLRPLLRAVLRARLLAVADAARVERGADHLVAEARKVLDPAAADEHDGVLLEVVPLAGDVGADLGAVRQPDARDLPKGRVRLLRRGRVHARADAALLRRTAERGGLRLRLRGLAALADELIDGGHGLRFVISLHSKRAGRAAALANRRGIVATSSAPRRARDPAPGAESRPLEPRFTQRGVLRSLRLSGRSLRGRTALQ